MMTQAEWDACKDGGLMLEHLCEEAYVSVAKAAALRALWYAAKANREAVGGADHRAATRATSAAYDAETHVRRMDGMRYLVQYRSAAKKALKAAATAGAYVFLKVEDLQQQAADIRAVSPEVPR